MKLHAEPICSARHPSPAFLILVAVAICFVVYVSPAVRAAGPAETPVFTGEEQEWMIRNPVIYYGADPEWPPFSRTNPEGQLEGIDTELLEHISQVSGLTFRYRPAPSWSDTLQMLRSGTISFTVGTARNEERVREFLFTREYLSFPVGIITRSDSEFLTTIEAMAGKRLAMPTENVLTDWVERVYPEVRIIPVASAADAHRYVATGRADATIENLLVSAFLIRNMGLRNLKLSGVVDQTFALRYCLRTDGRMLAGILDKSIRAVGPREINRIAGRWTTADVEEAVIWRRIRPWIITGAAAAVLILATSAIWIGKLRAEVVQRREAQEQLREASAKLTEIHEDRKALMQIAAHDLRNPLTALLASASLLRDGKLPPNEREPLLVNLVGSAYRIERLLKNLLSFESIDSGRFPIRKKSIPVRELFQRVIERQHSTAMQKGIAIVCTPEAPILEVECDQLATEEILENLVSNALKFSPPASTVTVSVGVSDGLVRFSIMDKGPGLSEADLQKLFIRFSKASAKPTAGEGSTGLGLWIARRLTELQGGKVWCENREGGGAVFHLELPHGRSTDAEVQQ